MSHWVSHHCANGNIWPATRRHHRLGKRKQLSITKSPTGIAGLDEITGGGIPRGRATLITGGPGCGKSVLALQTLVHGARERNEPGIFVAFEESAERIVANAASFGWDLEALQRKKLFFIDAQPSPDVINSGDADLQGLLAALDARAAQMGAKRIVLDSLDVLLSWVGDGSAAQREITRLNEWLLTRDATVLMTARATSSGELPGGALGFLPFMADCVVSLRHHDVEGVSQRSVRIQKYRGSGFAENAFPLIIGANGMQVAGISIAQSSKTASTTRVSTGMADLDAMLAGGYHAGASVLVTGAPGTAKTTLGGAFVESCCARGERALFVSFDSSRAELVRNLASVKVRLGRYVRSGLLRIETRHAAEASAEAHLLDIRTMIEEHNPTALVIDPISALGQQGNEFTAHSVVARLILLAKTQGITVFCTSLLESSGSSTEASRLQISTIADTWIHLTYVVHSGERNRALTVVKSRGTAHSNQVRELVLSSRGVSLEDVYTAEGEVLMGSLRLQREQADTADSARRLAERRRRSLQAAHERADLAARISALQRELALHDGEIAFLQDTERLADEGRSANRMDRIRRRGGGRAT